jgi:aromatic-L-amino-acid decarboxylase
MFTPFDLSAFYCRRMDTLRRAFSLVHEYLRTATDDVARNYMDYGIQLGRRFRSLKLWFIVRYFGTEGIAARLREQIRITQELASWIEHDRDWELMAPVPFSLVCFRFRPKQYAERLATSGDDEVARMEQEIDQLNAQLMEAVNASGRMFISHTKLNGKFTLRFAIGNIKTTEEHIRQSWDLLNSEAEKVKKSQ